MFFESLLLNGEKTQIYKIQISEFIFCVYFEMIYTIEKLLKMLVPKKTSGKLGLRRRHTGTYKLTANDRVIAEKSMKTINFVLILKLFLPKGGNLDDFLRLLVGRHITLTHTVERGLGECKQSNEACAHID